METDSPKRVTLRDIGQLVGVSHTTVFRVVNGYKNVDDATRQRVEAAIRDLGYQPDPALSALSAYRHAKASHPTGTTLAFFNCDGTTHTEGIFHGAQREALHLGYTLESFRLSPDKKAQARLSRILYSRGVHGLMFGPSYDQWQLEGWDWPKYASVSLGPLHHKPPFHAVAIDYFHAAMKSCEELHRLGCRRIALAVDPRLEARTCHRWFGGYCAGIEGFPQPVLNAGSLWNTPGLRDWLVRKKADGMLAIDSRFLERSRETWSIGLDLGLKVVLLIDDHLPGLTAMTFDRERVGTEGVRLLHHLLMKWEFGLPEEPKLLSLQGRLVHRDAQGNEVAAAPGR
ncbi:MAG: LacI family DNA-binding transcriptional regulator [Verrucomicrobiae bacterium]